jgi:hypothetical protein
VHRAAAPGLVDELAADEAPVNGDALRLGLQEGREHQVVRAIPTLRDAAVEIEAEQPGAEHGRHQD